MKPEVSKVLEHAAGTLFAELGPAVTPSYKQSTAMALGGMLICAREEFERAASRRVEENRVLRELFASAGPVVTDEGLRRRLEDASGGEEADLRISALQASNEALRGLLIELHEHVEERDDSEATRIDEAIWRELSVSTERRRLPIADF